MPGLNLVLIGVFVVAVGCAGPEFNRRPTTAESDCLSDVIQLTHDFDRAGEAYFSRDMTWIVFQATPRGEQQYQMFVAPVIWETKDVSPSPGSVMRATPMPNLKVPKPTDIARIGPPIRISPTNSRNTCGYFSPDGNSIVFASTAGKENPEEPTSGYQRQGGNYRWSYPEGMELFRADGWPGAIAAAEPGAIVDLAKHPLTNNSDYDAEASYSPDGKWLVFTSNRNDDLDLYAVRSDGRGAPVQLTQEPGYDGGAFFSPDGKRLVYRSDRSRNDLLQIFVADVVYDQHGSIAGLVNERQLTRDDGIDGRKANVNWGPYWHPDGRHIVYATSLHGHTNYELYLMRADGSRKTRLTFSGGADVLPVFSPDGKYLLWSSKRTKDGTTQIFLGKFKLPRGT
jgi:Tol biopolymer transport system component